MPEEDHPKNPPLKKPDLPRRFYQTVAPGEGPDGFTVQLDGKSALTPQRAVLKVDSRNIGEALVAEWRRQDTYINAAQMPLTRLVNVAIDAVASNPAETRADIVRYASSDLVCYRAREPEGLVERQSLAWDRVLEFAHTQLGARFILSDSVMFVNQPPEALAAIARAVEHYGPLPLAALHSAMTLCGSALIPLALIHQVLSVDTAWTAAHVDEDWNIQKWGEDAEALERRTRRRQEFDAAAFVLLNENMIS